MTPLRENRILARPATAADCLRDYRQHDPEAAAADSRLQHGQAQTDGNANGGQWHGRRH